MTKTETEILEMIAKRGLLKGGKVAPDTALRDAGVDSLDMAELLLSLEEEHEVSFDDDEVARMDTPSAIAAILDAKRL